MTRRELYRALSERIPRSLSEDWDNDGAMLLQDPEREVRRVLGTLDVTDEVVRYAKEGGFDLILSHHPLIFAPIRALDGEDPVSRRVLALLEGDVAVFSFHTRLDALSGGINDALCAMLGLENVSTVEGSSSIARIGTLKEPASLSSFTERLKGILGTPALNVHAVTDRVYRVAVVGGEGKDFIGAVTASGADTYLSGRLGYHAMLDGEINLIECGHYYSEKHAAALLLQLLREIARDVEGEIYTPNSLRVY